VSGPRPLGRDPRPARALHSGVFAPRALAARATELPAEHGQAVPRGFAFFVEPLCEREAGGARRTSFGRCPRRVITIASTPSLKASIRPVSHLAATGNSSTCSGLNVCGARATAGPS